jgi:putative tryptophan/tyrosine transport system substrate-binding protein
MRQREFIAMPVIGFLGSGSPLSSVQLAAFRKGLSEMGYVEGRNVAMEFRWARNDFSRRRRIRRAPSAAQGY